MFVHRAATKEIPAGKLPNLARVLLITDFSPCSEAAVPVARLMAESYGGTVTAAHFIFRDQDLGPNEAVIGTPEEIAGIAERQMAAFLTRNFLAQAESIIASGPFEEAIATLITEKQFDAVVVGTRGRSGVGKLLLGSVAQRVFNSAPCPVISVSRKARGGMGSTLNKILYATDLSDISKRALPYALSVAKANHAELLLACAPDDCSRADRMEQEFAEWTAFASAAWHRVEDMKEGVAAFVEKRKPTFKGR